MKILLIFISILLISCGFEPKQSNISTTAAVDTVVVVPDTMRIVFSGDFMQHAPQFNSAEVEGGYDYDTQLRAITRLWKSADFSIINLETTLSDVGRYSGYPMFCSPSAIAPALKRAGITHVALANNHVCDRGLKGIERTVAELDSAQLEYFGVGFEDNDYTLLQKGAIKIGVINATYGTNGLNVPKGVSMNSNLDTSRLQHNITVLDSLGATHIIAFLHWGNEYQTMPTMQQKKLALWLRSRGVDLVVGGHPHVAQPIDRDSSIVYSLGNFVSNQTKVNTDAGYSIMTTFTLESATPKIEHTTHYVDISGEGTRKYSILPLCDTLEVESHYRRKYMIEAINRVEKIVAKEVKYD